MHDPDIYEDPEAFRPERFIRNGKLDFSTSPDPAKFVFGFGRRYGAGGLNSIPSANLTVAPSSHVDRICPGRYFAENGLFINIASVLHIFDITPPVDEEGREIKIEPRVSNGLVWYVRDKTRDALCSSSILMSCD